MIGALDTVPPLNYAAKNGIPMVRLGEVISGIEIKLANRVTPWAHRRASVQTLQKILETQYPNKVGVLCSVMHKGQKCWAIFADVEKHDFTFGKSS